MGYGRRQRSLSRDVIVAIDQSGSMADSVVYAAVFGAVLASMPALSTQVVAFDTAVADLTPLLHDPVEVLFGVQLGGGTDIAQAVGYCQQLITRPADTVLVLVSDLFEGGNEALLRDRIAMLQQAGVTVVVLLALSDEGAPAYDHVQAAAFAALGVPSLACTPDAFPDLLAAALEGRDIGRWANEHGLHTAVPPAMSCRRQARSSMVIVPAAPSTVTVSPSPMIRVASSPAPRRGCRTRGPRWRRATACRRSPPRSLRRG